MREFEDRELFVWKCIVCGCKNKIHTELLDPITKKHVGYTVKCCACGDYHEFFNEHDSNGHQGHPDFVYGPQRCIQMSFCPHKDCKLYGTCKPLNPDKQPLPPDDDKHKPEQPPYLGKVVYDIIRDPRFL